MPKAYYLVLYHNNLVCTRVAHLAAGPAPCPAECPMPYSMPSRMPCENGMYITTKGCPIELDYKKI